MVLTHGAFLPGVEKEITSYVRCHVTQGPMAVMKVLLNKHTQPNHTEAFKWLLRDALTTSGATDLVCAGISSDSILQLEAHNVAEDLGVKWHDIQVSTPRIQNPRGFMGSCIDPRAYKEYEKVRTGPRSRYLHLALPGACWSVVNGPEYIRHYVADSIKCAGGVPFRVWGKHRRCLKFTGIDYDFASAEADARSQIVKSAEGMLAEIDGSFSKHNVSMLFVDIDLESNTSCGSFSLPIIKADETIHTQPSEELSAVA